MIGQLRFCLGFPLLLPTAQQSGDEIRRISNVGIIYVCNDKMAMAPQPTADEILEKLKRHRRNILLLLFRHGEIRTREIREEAGVPEGSKDHHLGVLQEWGLIEEVGRTTTSGGIPERVWGLTEDGSAFVDDHLTEEEERPSSYELRVERTEDKVEKLERTVEQQANEIEQLRGEKADQEETEARLDKIREDLQGTYWSAIIDEIEKRTAD